MSYSSLVENLIQGLNGVNLEQVVHNELSLNKRFSLYEISDELLLFFKHGVQGQSKVHIGFPFPLHSEDYDKDLNGLNLNVFLRGEPVRSIQRTEMRELSSNFTEMNDGFSKLVEDSVNQSKKVVFIDPYTFIGDSYIGLYFLDSVKNKFGINDSLVLSNQSDHLKRVVRSKKYNLENVSEEINDGDLIVAPDLIDSHWEKTVSTIKALKGKNAKMLILGRGLFLDIKRDKIDTYHFNSEDTLLRRENIEDYMSDCLKPFNIPGIAVSEKKKFEDTFRFFFNPFTSEELRYISPELMFNTYKSLSDMSKKTEFYLIAGYHKSPSHTEWLNKFLSLLKDDGSMRRVGINYYSDLSELADHLEEKECGSILTADTSVSHVANRLGYPNVTTYNPTWWDPNSLQSLSASSPAGFCRYFPTQIPVLNYSNKPGKMKPTADLLARTLIFSQQSQNKQKIDYQSNTLDWMNALYNPALVVQNVMSNPRATRLIESASKVSIFHKMEHLE